MADDGKIGLAHGIISLVLDKVIKHEGDTMTKVFLEFTYVWNFPRNMGLAGLLKFDNIDHEVSMFPEGIKGALYFMTDGPSVVQLLGGEVVIYRIVLKLKDNQSSAMIMLGSDGGTILATQNWDDDDSQNLQ